jgi:hypothetical protein
MDQAGPAPACQSPEGRLEKAVSDRVAPGLDRPGCLSYQLRAAVLLLFLSASAWCAGGSIEVTVVDSTNLPVAGVHVELQAGGAVAAKADTDARGRAAFAALPPAAYTVTAALAGFQTARKAGLDLPQDGALSLELTLIPALEHKESVEVNATASPVEAGAAPPETLAAQTAKELPGRPPTVADALPLLPGVVRKPDGGLQISGSAEHRSSLIVNSADVTDPATGQFGLTVPIDIVDTINVYQTPFLAEYGRFSEGLVSVETRRGGDKWKWELNDPFPDFYIRSWHLRGLRDATPRVNVEGPIVAGKLYLSEGLEFEERKIEIITLPFPNDQRKRSGVNSFAQLDWVASPGHLMTLTAHVAPQRLSFVGLDYFNPPSTTPDAATHNYTATLSDRLGIFGGVLENIVSATQFGARVWGSGGQDMIVTPTGNAGNYFSSLDRTASRLAWAPSYTFRSAKAWGTHTFKAGAYLAQSSNHGQESEHSIDILNADYRLTEQITFVGSHPYSLEDTEYAVYGQDHWSVSSRVALDLGLRADSQEVSQSIRMAPRAGIAWSPFAHTGTVVRAGFGFFYDHVPLNVYSFSRYPKENLTYYDPVTGDVIAGPYFIGNALDVVNVREPFVFRKATAGNFSPQSATGSLQVEQPLGHALRLRVGYIENQAAGLVVMNVVPPDPVTGQGANELTGAGQARYRQLEVTTRVRLGESRNLFFSYVRSHARGDLNDFNNYLGSFPIPIVRPNQFGNLPGDLPNRFLAWGVVPLPRGFRIAPVLEYRNGFPYYTVDAAQEYAGTPNQNRYPNFFALDSRMSKDIKVTPKYTVRLSVSVYNLTNHFNPEAFHNNIADPQYGIFFGQRQRRFTADFDVLF